MDDKTYGALVKRRSPNSPLLKNVLGAFFVGGAICTAGEGLFVLFSRVCGFEEDAARLCVSASLVTFSALLTAFGVYDRLAKIGGAGTLVPITGFANAMISPALEYRTEGLVLGTGVKLFSVAGPVLAFGTAASVVYGFFYWLFGVVGWRV